MKSIFSTADFPLSARYRQPDLDAFYTPPEALRPYWQRWSQDPALRLELLGESPQKRPLRALIWGQGPQRILLWSQMHGNEATATRALADFIAMLCRPAEPDRGRVAAWQEKLQLAIIPMLNPDGALRYSRRNAQGIDLNRDAVAQQSPEIQAFTKFRRIFDPHWAFNLHDQRSLFALGDPPRSASLSFLAPAAEETRKIVPARRRSMALISTMLSAIPRAYRAHIGRYNDEFYPKALGDNLMQEGLSNLLFEAGAFPGDPQREVSRALHLACWAQACDVLASDDWNQADIEAYQHLPLNHQRQCDWCFRQVELAGGAMVQVALQEEWRWRKGQLESYWLLRDLGDLDHWGALVERRENFRLSGSIVIGEAAQFQLERAEEIIRFEHGRIH